MLELTPALGRLLSPEDDRAVGESHVVVLSHAYWATRFASNPNALNQPLIVNGQTLTIVGVAPRGFDGTTMGSKPQVFVPITLRGLHGAGLQGLGQPPDLLGLSVRPSQARRRRSRPRAPRSTAQYHAIVNDVEAPLQKGMSEQTMNRFRSKLIGVEPGGHGQSSTPAEAKTPLYMLMGVTGFVLLIACANIANLLLARSAARAGEMAIRLSIGATRWHLIAQLLTESLLLALFGGLAGLFVAHWTLRLDPVAAAGRRRRKSWPSRSTRAVILFGAAVTVGTGLLFGLFPALHSTRPDLLSTLKGQSGQPSGARGAARFRLALATAQIALSLALLAAAGFFVKSLLNVSRVDLGVKIDNVIAFGLSPELNGYTPERTRVFFERLEEKLRGRAGRHRRHRLARAAARRQQLGQRRRRPGIPGRPRHRQQRALQRGRPRLLPDAGRAADVGARIHRRPTDSKRAEGRDRQRRVREEVQSRSRRGRQDDRVGRG